MTAAVEAEAPTRAARYVHRVEMAAEMTVAAERLLLANQQAAATHAALEALEQVLAAAERNHAGNERRREELVAMYPLPPVEDPGVAGLWGEYGPQFRETLAEQAAHAHRVVVEASSDVPPPPAAAVSPGEGAP